MREYRLNAFELGIAALLASQRQMTTELSNTRSRRVGTESEWDANFIGAKAEVAFGQLFNRSVPLSFMPRSGGADFVMNKDCTVDVKATENPNGNLICPPHSKDKRKASRYVLAVVSGDEVVFHGWATHDELFDDANLRPLFAGGPPTYVIKRENLRPMEEPVEATAVADER